MPPVAQAVSDFLARIPKQQLAQAASRCGAHARALQYYESYVRGVQGGGLNPAAFKADVLYKSSQVGRWGCGCGVRVRVIVRVRVRAGGPHRRPSRRMCCARAARWGIVFVCVSQPLTVGPLSEGGVGGCVDMGVGVCMGVGVGVEQRSTRQHPSTQGAHCTQMGKSWCVLSLVACVIDWRRVAEPNLAPKPKPRPKGKWQVSSLLLYF